MSHPLPRAWSLITDSWHAFVKTWDLTVRVSAWFIPAVILQNLYIFLPTSQEPLRLAVGLVGVVAGVLLMIWAATKLYYLSFAIEEGKKESQKADADIWRILPSLILVGILEMLCVAGGLLLLVLPGIYISIRLGFSQLSLLDKGTKGRQALIASWALTKDRFWPVFGRQLAAGFLFMVAMMIVTTIAMMVVGLVAGNSFSTLMKDTTNPLADGVSSIIASIVQAALVPLIALFQVKLYRALQK
jgi:hypothetical protein